MHRLVAARRRHAPEVKHADAYCTVRAMLREFGAVPVTAGVAVEGGVLTAAGVSFGSDMPLRPAGIEAGEEEACPPSRDRLRPRPAVRQRFTGGGRRETQRRAIEHMARATEEVR